VKEQNVKRILTIISAAAIAATVAAPRPAVAQEKPALVPLKLQLVVSRTLGDKKVSSLPYTLWITANRGGETALRMGVNVPIPTTIIGKEGATQSYSYRDVGTNIDCSATTAAEGYFNVSITLNDSSIQFDTKESASRGTVPGVPSFRNFLARFGILLKDGQTAQYTSATDPVSGETLKVDVTLNVLK
jgi:hypothetical protein